MTKRMNKYTYYKVLQEFVKGFGWSDSVYYDKSDPDQLRELRSDIKSYRAEGIRVRVIERRELNK